MNFLSWMILILIFAAFAAVLWTMLQRKKKGQGSCSCSSCGSCPMKGTCGRAPKQEERK